MGQNHPEFLSALTRRIREHQCLSEHYYSRQIEGNIYGCLTVSGSWGALVKLESAFKQLCEAEHVHFQVERVNTAEIDQAYIPYLVHVTGLDTPSFMEELLSFFVGGSVHCTQISGATSYLGQSKTRMQQVTLHVRIPVTLPLSQFRDHVLTFCDDYNLDAIFEPDRG
ncbi:MAG: hypothetical protein EBX40_05395 [Gammaproteobacteria bacterium]|nr:hypothetical protein [Gammaproteobacteria bacterium]